MVGLLILSLQDLQIQKVLNLKVQGRQSPVLLQVQAQVLLVQALMKKNGVQVHWVLQVLLLQVLVLNQLKVKVQGLHSQIQAQAKVQGQA